MEFKLNKIDTDIIKKMNEETKDNKVHSGKGINVNKDLKDEESQSKDENSIKEKMHKRYITIDAVKDENRNIDVKAEKVEKINESNSKGRILDTIK